MCKSLSPVVLSDQNSPSYLFRSVFTQLDLCIILSWFRCGFFCLLEKAILRIVDLCFCQKQRFDVNKMLSDGLESYGLLVEYYDVFISCLDSHSDGIHSLQRIHWWASDVMLHFSKSFLMKKQTNLHHYVHPQQIFIRWIIFLKTKSI